MASIGGVSRNNMTSSLYNSANVISGLASGLDTEGMIESLVKSYQTKINQLAQKSTKLEWKQDAYRSIIQKMVGFSSKYTSYTSSTNLTSPSFFSNAVRVVTKGDFKDSVSASGKTSSDIELNAAHQLAKAAQYRTKSSLATGASDMISGGSVNLFETDPSKQMELSNLSGGLTLTYGSKTVSLSFDETKDVEAMKDIRAKLAKEQNMAEADVKDADVLAGLINQKLADQKIVFNSGNSESADQRIKAIANADGRIVFEEQGTAQNGVYISGASGNIASQLGLSEDALKDAKENKIAVIDTNGISDANGNKGLTRNLRGVDYLAEKGAVQMNMSLDGVTKQINMPDVRVVKKDGAADEYYLNGEKVNAADFAGKYTEALQASVKSAFGDKVTVSNKGENGELKLEFKMKNEGSELVINSDVGNALGIGKTATSYLNTGKTLKDLMGDKLSGLTPVYEKNEDGSVKTNYDGQPVPKLDDKGKEQYEFKLNGVTIGTYTEDTQLSKILSDINANEDAGVKVAYSQATQSFTFTAKETGKDSKIELGDGLAQAMFGKAGNAGAGADAKIGSLLEDKAEYNKEFANFGINVGGIDLNLHADKDSDLNSIANDLNDMLSVIGPAEGVDYTAAVEDGKLVAKDGAGKAVDLSYTSALSKDFAKAMENASGSTYTAGQDAMFTVTVNGEQKNMVRSSNSANIDGLTINMNETFNSEKADGSYGFKVAETNKSVSFQSKTDSDKIIDAVKAMAEEYNTMMAEIKSAYSTMPYQQSNGALASYEPLTEDDRAGMSESAIERYEAKAKQGILFGDRNLSNLYSKMSEAFSFSNTKDVDTLREMGLELTYSISDGTQALQVDEDKLRDMLDSDPERVAELFTKTDGIMDRMKTELDYYAKTTGEPKGLLIQQAGSPLSSLSLLNNQWQSEIDNISTQIEKWQDKLTSQVDKYTSMFSRLEVLINQMNSQSSTLAGLMGG